MSSIWPTIWEAPLESLCDGLAAAKPAPAGVTAAAVSARLGVALLIKTLEITARRGHAETTRGWLTAARRYSEILAEAANDDIVGAPDRKRIEIPMNAARAAVAGLDLCAEAAGAVRGALAADLGAAAMLLYATVRAILLCADSNAAQIEAEERRELARHAMARQESIILWDWFPRRSGTESGCNKCAHFFFRHPLSALAPRKIRAIASESVAILALCPAPANSPDQPRILYSKAVAGKPHRKSRTSKGQTNMFRSARVLQTVLAITAAAICMSGGTAYGAGVQVSLAGSFNADSVLRYSGAFTTPGIAYDNPTAGGSVDNWMVTQSAATQLATSQGVLSPAPVGINDNGLYPASGARLYDVQLGFTNATATATNTAIRSSAVGNFTFSVPNNQYSQFAIFGSGGSGYSTLTITLTYSGGSPVVLTGVTLPDWYSGNSGSTAASAAGTNFVLTPPLSRQAAYLFPGSGYQAPVATGAFIYGINLGPDPTRVLTSVAVSYTPQSVGYTAANFLAAAGAIAGSTLPSTPAPSTLILVLTGLSLVCWYFLRGQRRAA